MKQVGYFFGWIWGWMWIAVVAGLLLGFYVGYGTGWLAFFGVLGLIVASGLIATIVAAVSGQFREAKKRCPLCKEMILADAIRCKHCGSDVGLHERLEQLYARLRTGDVGEQLEIVNTLVDIGTPGVPILVDTLQHNMNWKVRAEAAIALSKVKDVRAFPALVGALQDEHSVVVEMAAESLGRLGDRRAVPHLIDAMRDDPSLLGVTSALSKLKDPAAIPGLIAFMHKSSGMASSVAAHTLTEFGAQAVPALEEAYRTGNSETRGSAAYALTQIGAPAVPILLDFLHHEDLEQAGTAAYHLATMGDVARPAVTRLLHSPDENMRKRASMVLKHMDRMKEEAEQAAGETA